MKLVPYSSDPSRRVTRPNEVWSIDFMVLCFAGDPYVMLVGDCGTGLPLSATLSLPSGDEVVPALEQLAGRAGSPQELWVDVGRSYLHRSIKIWSEQRGISVTYGPPGRTDVAERLLRSLNAFLRDKRLSTLRELAHEVERWRRSYGAASSIPSGAALGERRG